MDAPNLFFLIACALFGSRIVRIIKEPVFDASIGKSEQQIIEQFGKPIAVNIKAARLLKDELRAPLESKVTNGDVLIKELYYETSRGEKIFWLIEYEKEKWKVISDVKIPKGVYF